MNQYSPYKDMRILANVKVPMRDGVRLATTVYLPLEEGRYPVVFIRSAYGRSVGAAYYIERGMAVVGQDTRGRYSSEGEYYPFVAETNDGLDALDWIAAQPWCDGNVGMYGDSYLGAVQYAVAAPGHPVLTALNPRFMAGDIWQHGYYFDGVFCLALDFSWLCLEANASTSDAHLLPLFNVEGVLRHLPLGTIDEVLGVGEVPAFRDFLKHETRDDYWSIGRWRETLSQTKVPMLLHAGWYDYYAGDAFLNFQALQEVPEMAKKHRIIVGPWTHGVNGSSVLGEFDFGEAARAENGSSARWLECLLKGGDPTDFMEAPIRLFVMGENVWRDEWEWPLARTEWTNLYLHSDGTADSNGETATLSRTAPEAEPVDKYTYDPENPVPTTGGNHSVGPYNPGLYEFCLPGPYQQSRVEERPDVLVYTGPVLEEDTEVTGPVIVKLFASSSAVDTDFVARLCDVYPDGRSFNITEGVIRAAFHARDWQNPQHLEPGHIYEFTIDLQATSTVFKKGHRIRLQVTSSNFPLWARNLNTGEPIATAVNFQSAHQTIYHDAEHPSHIVLPLIPR